MAYPVTKGPYYIAVGTLCVTIWCLCMALNSPLEAMLLGKNIFIHLIEHAVIFLWIPYKTVTVYKRYKIRGFRDKVWAQ